MAFLNSLALFIIFNLTLFHGGSMEIIYEDGYIVTTVFDGNKLKINPHSLVPRSESNDLILLDSSNSLFYTLSLPLYQDGIKRFAGNGMAGFSDGDAGLAMFNKPRNFAMDFKGNVYVADRSNFAVRKISGSGVTTIAGGYSKTAGRVDGPGRNATFSTDYELTFVPDMCALLILDHGHKLIRQINLKQEDCKRSESGVGATAVWPWVVAVALSCLVGLVIGFAIRPYITLREEFKLLSISKSWMNYPMNLGRQTRTHCFGTRSAVASPALKFIRRIVMMVLSNLSLMLNFRIKGVSSSSSSVCKDYVSLLDSDNYSSSERVSSCKYTDQLRELISVDGDHRASNVCNDILKQDVAEKVDRHGQIHDLMQANITNFSEDARKSTVLEGQFLGVSTLVKRK